MYHYNDKSLIMETFKIVIMGKVFHIRAKEIAGWIPYFIEDGSKVECENLEVVGNLNDDLEEGEF